MTEVQPIKITRTGESRLQATNFDNLPFGRVFTDHMLMAVYDNGAWGEPEIVEYKALPFTPGLAVLHYGQAIFEGIKGYKDKDGRPFVFRPHDNYVRFNTSARRMNMPPVPEHIFMEGMRELISLERDWIPTAPEHSLYIRPFMYAADEFLGVRPSEKYVFLIILSPSGPYFAAPMRIAVEEHYTRAVKGGVGFAKNAGNYGGSLLAATEARERGFDQVLWTDSEEHKWLQEVGVMNVFFIINNTVITPSLEDGTILHGVTRQSVITILKDMGYTVEERGINIDELVNAYKQGQVKEIFGTGTAAVIAPLKELNYKGYAMTFDPETFTISQQVKQRLLDIRDGVAPDTHGWIWRIDG